MANKIYKDSEILRGMEMHLDEDSVVYGANGHYGIGAYYDITKVNSVFNKSFDYNNESNIDAASETAASEQYRTDNDSFDENIKKAEWLKNY